MQSIMLHPAPPNLRQPRLPKFFQSRSESDFRPLILKIQRARGIHPTLEEKLFRREMNYLSTIVTFIIQQDPARWLKFTCLASYQHTNPLQFTIHFMIVID